MSMKTAYVAGTFDTKEQDLVYIASRIRAAGVPVKCIDLSTTNATSAAADIGPKEVAAFHPDGTDAVFTGDRGSSIKAMSEAFIRFLCAQEDLGGAIGAGGTGGTALVAPAFRALPIGTPKMLVSTVASGDVRPYVGPSDICMMYSVTDVQGINRISRQVLANAAHALAGMISNQVAPSADDKPAMGFTMFGVTTPCIQSVTAAFEKDHDCLVFHATGVGGQSMEKLVEGGHVVSVGDLTTTEIADHFMGGVFSAGEGRLDAIINTGVPYVGSVGALDMVNFGAPETIPSRYKDRKFHIHNPQVTLMRTTPEENAKMGAWLVRKLNRMDGPVRFLLPLRGVSIIDIEGETFYDPEADSALFDAIRSGFDATPDRQLIEVDAAINDPEFIEAAIAALRNITPN